MKTWTPAADFECPCCAGEIEILTDAHEWGIGEPPVTYFDNDDTRCTDCDWRACVHADEHGASVGLGNDGDLDDEGRLSKPCQVDGGC